MLCDANAGVSAGAIVLSAARDERKKIEHEETKPNKRQKWYKADKVGDITRTTVQGQKRKAEVEATKPSGDVPVPPRASSIRSPWQQTLANHFTSFMNNGVPFPGAQEEKKETID